MDLDAPMDGSSAHSREAETRSRRNDWKLDTSLDAIGRQERQTRRSGGYERRNERRYGGDEYRGGPSSAHRARDPHYSGPYGDRPGRRRNDFGRSYPYDRGYPMRDRDFDGRRERDYRSDGPYSRSHRGPNIMPPPVPGPRGGQHSPAGYRKTGERAWEGRARGGHFDGPPRGRRRQINDRHLLSAPERALTQCEVVEDEYTYAVKLKDTIVVSVDKSSGELKLDSGGWRTISTLGVMNACLRPLNMNVAEDEAQESGEHSLLGGSWSVRYYTQGKGKAANVVQGKGLAAGQTAEMQSFEDGGVVSIGSDIHPYLVSGRASIMKQYLTQHLLALKARIKFGNRPPTLTTLPDDVFIQTNVAHG